MCMAVSKENLGPYVAFLNIVTMLSQRKRILWCLLILLLCLALSLVNVLNRRSGKLSYQIKPCNSSTLKALALQVSIIKEDRDSDDEKFIQYMKGLKPGKPKAAIYYLANADTRGLIVKDGEGCVILEGRDGPSVLIVSLNSLQENFLSNYSYPVIIFHEKDFRRYKKRVKEETHIKHLFFIEIEFEIPSFLVKPVPVLAPCTGSHTIGYRHMCRFQAKTVYDQPVLNHIDYILRLDDDSKINDFIKYDIFDYFLNYDYTYGYLLDSEEARNCITGLDEVINNYIASNDIKIKNILPELFIYYNNFELSKVSFWKSQEYQNFIEYIDRLGGIYYHRWGDAPIKTKAVAAFVPPNKIIQLKNINYVHQGVTST